MSPIEYKRKYKTEKKQRTESMSGCLGEAEELEATLPQRGLVCSFINPASKEAFFIISVGANMFTAIQHAVPLPVHVCKPLFILYLCRINTWTDICVGAHFLSVAESMCH